MRHLAHFECEGEVLRDRHDLHLEDNSVRGPLSFLIPTQARYQHIITSAGDKHGVAQHDTDKDDGEVAKPSTHSGVAYKWTSRNNRKGRHALVVDQAAAARTSFKTPLPRTHWRKIIKTSRRMLTSYPAYDISWDIAYIFTWGSIVWVINAFFAFLPLLVPSTEFHNEVYMGGGITAFIGATIFEIGSVLLMLEAINETRSACFGWAIHEIMEHDGSGEHGPRLSIQPDTEHCAHHHSNRKNLVGKPQDSATVDPSTPDGKTWQWWPSNHELRTHYIHSLGFIACLSQFFGATVFWISGFTALPGIYNHLGPAAVKGAYWAPQIIGGSGFVVSGTLFMLETQTHWYKPAFDVLGWHIGLWNLVGGVGFTLCPAFGLDVHSWAQYQASCSTFWGSWAFLVGSLLQLYESLEKNPVEVKRN